MAIKNAYVTSPMSNIVSDIQKDLVNHRAQKIMFGYDNGSLICLSFGIEIDGKLMGVKLPAKVSECETILKKQGLFSTSKKDHALRVAWANIRDWVSSQMAMIDIGQVKIEQVFLPYIINGDRTIYEIIAENKFNALPSGEAEMGVVEK